MRIPFIVGMTFIAVGVVGLFILTFIRPAPELRIFFDLIF